MKRFYGEEYWLAIRHVSLTISVNDYELNWHGVLEKRRARNWMEVRFGCGNVTGMTSWRI